MVCLVKERVLELCRWDTFGKLLDEIPDNEAKFRSRYVKAPSFLSMHLGVDASCIPVRTHPSAF